MRKTPAKPCCNLKKNLNLQRVMEYAQKYDGSSQQQGKPELPGLPSYSMEARHQGKGKENIRDHIRPDVRANPLIQERSQTNHHHERQQKKSKPA